MYFAYFPILSMAMKNIQVRVDEKLKNKAEKIFKRIGIDTPTAFRIFLLKVTDFGGIPFSLVQDDFEDNYSPKDMAEIDRAVKEAKAGIGLSRSYDSVEELIKDLHTA